MRVYLVLHLLVRVVMDVILQLRDSILLWVEGVVRAVHNMKLQV
jgi:hypothetical protein